MVIITCHMPAQVSLSDIVSTLMASGLLEGCPLTLSGIELAYCVRLRLKAALEDCRLRAASEGKGTGGVKFMSGADNVPSRLFIHYMFSNPQIRCVAADILWQPSSLPCLGISTTM